MNLFPVAPFLFLVLLISGALFSSCSLRPMAAVQVRLPDTLRDNPALAEMDRFAVAISGSVGGTLAASEVGNRSLDCLNLSGQVSFPYTLAELIEGVSITVAPGEYRFTIVGFDGVTGSPSTVGQMFGTSANLTGFIIAQASFSTVTSPNVTLTSLYQPASATDLLTACPAPAGTLHTLFNMESSLQYLKYASGVWSYSTVSGTLIGDYFGLAVDSLGVAHVAYAESDGGQEPVSYANNSTGSFIPNTVYSLTSFFPFDLAVTGDGVRNFMGVLPTNFLEVALFPNSGGSAWIPGPSVLSTASGSFSRVRVKEGPENTLIAVALTNFGPPSVHVAMRDTSGIWGSGGVLTTAGAGSCSVSINSANAVIDAYGFGHLLFLCDSGPSATRLGYATNRTGAWVTADITGAVLAAKVPSFTIDQADTLHAVFVSVGNLVHYLSANAITGNWSPTELALSATGPVDGVAVGAFGPQEIHVVYAEDDGGGTTSLRTAKKTNGQWASGSPIGVNLPASVLLDRIVAR